MLRGEKLVEVIVDYVLIPDREPSRHDLAARHGVEPRDIHEAQESGHWSPIVAMVQQRVVDSVCDRVLGQPVKPTKATPPAKQDEAVKA